MSCRPFGLRGVREKPMPLALLLGQARLERAELSNPVQLQIDPSQAIAIRLEAIATGLKAIATRLETIPIRLETLVDAQLAGLVQTANKRSNSKHTFMHPYLEPASKHYI